MAEENDTIANLRCFIIGPIGDKLAEYGTAERDLYEESIETWESIIEPACRACGLEPLRSDRISKSGEIPEQICRHLRDDEVVIADLTRANPNVMYELGLRHTTGRLTIQIGEKGKLPFDISAIRTIMFRRTESGLVDGRRALEQAIRAGLSGGNDPVTATRLWLGMRPNLDADNDAEQTQQETQGEEEEEEGFLDTLASSEAEISNLGQVVRQLIDPLSSISELFVSSTQNLKTSDASGGGFSGRLAIASKLAEGLNQQADELSPIVDEYERKMRRIAPGIDLLLGRIAETKESGTGIDEFIEQMLFFSNSVHDSVSTTKDFETMLAGIGSNSKDLRRVTTRISKILSRFRDASSPAADWRTRLTRLKELANGPATNQAEIAQEE